MNQHSNIYEGCFGDKRLADRAHVIVQRSFAASSIVVNRFADERKEVVGAGRFFSNARVQLEDLVQATTEAGMSQIKTGRHYLVVSDTTDINMNRNSGRLRVQDGDIGRTGYQAEEVGFFVHPSLLLEAEQGFPLGYSNIFVWNRAFGGADRLERDYKALPVEEKESAKWLVGLRRAVQQLPVQARYTHLMDSDADMYELFAEPRAARHELLVRACRQRRLAEPDEGLMEFLSQLSAAHAFELDVRSTHKRRGRRASLEVRFAQVALRRPEQGPRQHLPAKVPVFVVEVRERPESVPTHEKPIHWILYTTHVVECLADALRVVQWYRYRWRIEELFSLLKSKGVALEDSQLTTGAAWKKQAVVGLQTALYLLQLIKDRHGEYGQSLTLILTPEQEPFLERLITHTQGSTPAQRNPHPPRSLARLAWLIGRLGGWKGYASESPPGPKTMSRGWRVFHDRWQGYRLALPQLE